MFFSYANFQRSQKRHCYQLHWDTLFQECFWSRSINSRVGFYRGIKPRGKADWLYIYTTIKPSHEFIKHYFNSPVKNSSNLEIKGSTLPHCQRRLTDQANRRKHTKLRSWISVNPKLVASDLILCTQGLWLKETLNTLKKEKLKKEATICMGNQSMFNYAPVSTLLHVIPFCSQMFTIVFKVLLY